MARGPKKSDAPNGDDPGDPADPPPGDDAAPKPRPARRPRPEPSTPLPDFGPAAAELTRLVETLTAQCADAARELADARAQLQALRDERADAARELADLRRQAREAHDALVRDARSAAGDAQRASDAVGEKVRDAGDRLAAEFLTLLGRTRDEAEAAQEAVRGVVGQAEDLRGRLTDLEGRADELTAAAADVRGRLAAVRVDVGEAEGRVEAVRATLARAEAAVPALPPPAGSEPQPPPYALGVLVDPAVVVAEVVAGSPAAAAGLAPGDVVTAVNGAAVWTGPELHAAVRATGGAFALAVRRDGAPLTLDVRPGAPAGGPLGATVEAGAVVVEVLPGSPAADAGLAAGDVITEADDAPVLTGEDLRDALFAPPEGDVVLRVRRGAAVREVRALLDQPAAVPFEDA